MKTKAKPSYKVRNWSQYNAALKQRGSLTFWLDEAVIDGWINERRHRAVGKETGLTSYPIALQLHIKTTGFAVGKKNLVIF